MGSGREPDVLVRIAFDVELLSVVEHRKVTIGRVENQEHGGVLGDDRTWVSSMSAVSVRGSAQCGGVS